MLDAGRKRTRRETIRAAMDAARSEGKPTLVTRRHTDGVYRWWWCADFNNGHLNNWWDVLWIEPDGETKIMFTARH